MKRFCYAAVIIIAIAACLVWAERSKKIFSRMIEQERRAAVPQMPLRQSRPAGILLNECWNLDLKIKFLCDFAWYKKEVDQNSVYYIVDTAPSVKLKIVKIDLGILTIQQLNREKLEAIGQYDQGFVTEEAKVAGFKAVKVKAYAKNDLQTRLMDYYFVRDQRLYIMMFSVHPKEKWDNYKFIFQEIVESLQFYE